MARAKLIDSCRPAREKGTQVGGARAQRCRVDAGRVALDMRLEGQVAWTRGEKREKGWRSRRESAMETYGRKRSRVHKL